MDAAAGRRVRLDSGDGAGLRAHRPARRGLIPIHFSMRNETLVEWVADSDWSYSTTLRGGRRDPPHEHVELVFEGLDTLATITAQRAPKSPGRRTCTVRIASTSPSLLTDGENRLDVTFDSATKYCDALREREGTGRRHRSSGPTTSCARWHAAGAGTGARWLTTAGIWRRSNCTRGAPDRLVSVRPTARVDAPTRDGRRCRRDDGCRRIPSTSGSGILSARSWSSRKRLADGSPARTSPSRWDRAPLVAAHIRRDNRLYALEVGTGSRH
jgi:hypothetical protein